MNGPWREGRMAVWKSPSGRIHLQRWCSGGTGGTRARRVRVTEEQYVSLAEADKVCRCVQRWRADR